MKLKNKFHKIEKENLEDDSYTCVHLSGFDDTEVQIEIGKFHLDGSIHTTIHMNNVNTSTITQFILGLQDTFNNEYIRFRHSELDEWSAWILLDTNKHIKHLEKDTSLIDIVDKINELIDKINSLQDN